MSFWQVWEIQDQEKNLHAIEKDNSKTARRELDQFIRDTIAESKKWRPTLVYPIASVYLKLNRIKSLFVKMRNYQILP